MAQTFLRIHLILPAMHFILLINIRYLFEDLPNRVSGSILGFTLGYNLLTLYINQELGQ